MCAECGSACPAGYTSYTSNLIQSTCGPHVQTSALHGDIIERNSQIGCIPCPLPTGTVPYAVSFIKGCAFACNGPSSAPVISSVDNPCSLPTALIADNRCRGYWCDGTISTLNGSCSGTCRFCTCPDGACSAEKLSAGKYWATCTTGVGVMQGNCDTTHIPANAHFTSSAGYSMSTGCKWACTTGYMQNALGQCAVCTATPRCVSGQVAMPCQTSTSLKYCMDCFANTNTQTALQPYQTWTTVQNQCVPTCTSDAYLQTAYGIQAICVPCTKVCCSLGQFLNPCNLTRDAACESCPNAIATNSEYVTAGDCSIQCVSGFYRVNPSSAASSAICAPCSIWCPVGQRQTLCASPSERLASPACVSCPPPANGTRYVTEGSCAPTCSPNWMSSSTDIACVPCQPALCAMGQLGSCASGNLTCSLCRDTGLLGRQLPANREYIAVGSCDSRCKPGTAAAHDSQTTPCMPVMPIESIRTDDIPPIPNVIYPTRSLPHSNHSIMFDWMQP